MIYADNAATTPVSPAARAAMIDAMDKLWGNPSSLYTFGQLAEEALSDARARVAGCLGAEPGEIIFTSGGSEADNQALRSAAALGAKKGRRHIISTAFEHHAVLHTLDALKAEGFEVTLLPVHADGLVRPEELAAALGTNRTYLSAYIKATYRVTFREWVAGLRIGYAKQMLMQHPEMTVSAISEASGFLSLSHFTRIFTEKEGCTPSKWRKSEAAKG